MRARRTEVSEVPEIPPTIPSTEGAAGIPQEPSVQIELSKEEKPVVFISHSKNKTIVDQIKTILEFGQFDYGIAEETETTAIPIPESLWFDERMQL